MARRIDTGAPPHHPSLLVADGSPTNRLVLRSILENAGYRIELADSGPAVLAAVRGRAFDLVVLDADLPKLDGLSVIRRIRALPGRERRVPVLAISTNPETTSRTACLAAGADDALLKPFRCSDLKAAAALLLDPASGFDTGTGAAILMPAPPGDAIEPVLDAEILARLGGDLGPGAFADVLVTFTQDMGVRLHRIAAAAASANLRTLVFESHAVSSCCRTVGALRLAQLCGTLETAALSGDRDQALNLAFAIGSVGADTLSILSGHGASA